MRGAKIPNLFRNAIDGSITLTYQQPKYSLIWLHGFGDQPDSYVPYFTHLLSPLYKGCRIHLLSAPTRLQSATNTYASAWYDPLSPAKGEQNQQKVDTSQINKSISHIHQFFKEESQFWNEQKSGKISPNHRIYVGGMGQGASLALNYSYEAEAIPAGVIALSGSLLPHSKLKNLRKMPALLLHGRKDGAIRQMQARRSYGELLKDEFLVQYQAYDNLQHGVNLQQLKKITSWLQESHEFIRKHYESTQ